MLAVAAQVTVLSGAPLTVIKDSFDEADCDCGAGNTSGAAVFTLKTAPGWTARVALCSNMRRSAPFRKRARRSPSKAMPVVAVAAGRPRVVCARGAD